MSIQEVSAEELARRFHTYHQALARGLNPHAGGGLSVSWDETPQSERKLMVAAARLTLVDLAESHQEELPSRRYFAKPGEADWGC